MLNGGVPSAHQRGDKGRVIPGLARAHRCSSTPCPALGGEAAPLSAPWCLATAGRASAGATAPAWCSFRPSDTPGGCTERGLFPAWLRNIPCTSLPPPSSGTHTQAPGQGLWLTVALNSRQILLLFLSHVSGRDRVTAPRKGLENIVPVTPLDPRSWGMQMAPLQRHQEPSSRETDPSCKIIRLLIAPAHSSTPGHRPVPPFSSGRPCSPPWPGSGWCCWPVEEEGPWSWVERS